MARDSGSKLWDMVGDRVQPNDPERSKKPRPQPEAGWNCPNSRDRAGASVPAIDVHASSLK
jgi:hypothetical protein